MSTISFADFTTPLLTLFAEMFGVSGTPHGFVLDDGNSGLLATLDSVDAEMASKALSPEHATIASHSAHILDLLYTFHRMALGEIPDTDWSVPWTLREVNAYDWEERKSNLRAAYAAVISDIQANPDWSGPRVGGALALLAHCSYHCGEIRQMRTTVLAQSNSSKEE